MADTKFDLKLLTTDEYGQHKLAEAIESWTDSVKKDNIINDLTLCDKSYPGGLLNYIKRSRDFLDVACKGTNPFEGFEPNVPITLKLSPETESFERLEKKGLDASDGLAFCMVAGGLGERLGYSGIKVELPVECVTNTCYLQLYCEYIKAFETVATKRTGKPVVAPFAIMTSDDTYEKTVDLLEKNSNFGLTQDQITIMKQEKVPSLTDSSANLAFDNGTGHMITKPHGHGDVHQLLLQKGLPKKWLSQGKTHLFIFQDTNALAFRSLPASLGFSLEENLAMNFLTVPRKAEEAVGAIVNLKKKEGECVTMNVEYNQLGPLLKSNGMGGDTADPTTGFSPYPGNINVLLFELNAYSTALDNTGGNVPEFVNPKFADETRTTFKSPTRLECLMQDFSRLLGKGCAVGCVEAPRVISFSTVKNHYSDAAKKVETGGVPESTFSGEADYYSSNAEILKMAFKSKDCTFDLGDSVEDTWLGVKYALGPKVVLKPSFGVCLTEIKNRIVNGSYLKVTSESTLVLSGDVTIKNVEVDGTLVVTPKKGVLVTLDGVECNPKKAKMVEVNENDPVAYQIRGYTIEMPLE